jgi:hypothetical protein
MWPGPRERDLGSRHLTDTRRATVALPSGWDWAAALTSGTRGCP